MVAISPMYSFGVAKERVTEQLGGWPGGWVAAGGSTAEPVEPKNGASNFLRERRAALLGLYRSLTASF